MKVLPFLLGILVLTAGCIGGGEKMDLKVSSVFGENEFIPSKYTCEGIDVSPPLRLEGLSDKAVSI
ncbi:YbhB/YbcL family Raf kinase inhibitor-like protein, partial [Thermococci archaeon]